MNARADNATKARTLAQLAALAIALIPDGACTALDNLRAEAAKATGVDVTAWPTTPRAFAGRALDDARRFLTNA